MRRSILSVAVRTDPWRVVKIKAESVQGHGSQREHVIHKSGRYGRLGKVGSVR